MDDLKSHRRHYRGSAYKWGRANVLDVIDFYTQGRREFTTLAGLHVLTKAHSNVADLQDATRLALAAPLKRAAAVGGWSSTTEIIGIESPTARQIVSDAARPEACTVSSLSWHATEHLGDNPLIQATEIRQAWLLSRAAAEMADQALTSLVAELRNAGHSPNELAAAAEAPLRQITDRILRSDLPAGTARLSLVKA